MLRGGRFGGRGIRRRALERVGEVFQDPANNS
jgi:hypothetical protein